MYKCNFPLDKFKSINTICASVFTEYFISEGGFIYGTSNLKWCLRIGVLPTKSDDLIPLISNALIPPNAMRSVLADAKKTMTYVNSASDGVDFMRYKDKIDKLIPNKDNVTLDALQNIDHETFTLPRFAKDDGSEVDRIAKEIACRVGPYAALVDEKELIELDIDEIGNAFRSESIYTVIDENDSTNSVMLGKNTFNDFNKILNISWKPYEIDDTYGLAVFRVEYPEMALFTFIKFIKGIA